MDEGLKFSANIDPDVCGIKPLRTLWPLDPLAEWQMWCLVVKILSEHWKGGQFLDALDSCRLLTQLFNFLWEICCFMLESILLRKLFQSSFFCCDLYWHGSHRIHTPCSKRGERAEKIWLWGIDFKAEGGLIVSGMNSLRGRGS